MNPARLTKFRVAVYGVLIENGKVLFTNTKVPSGVIVNFPGGGLELGESPIDALTREFMEETGITVSIEELLFCSRLFQQNPEYPSEQLMHIYYRVHRIGGEMYQGGNNDDVLDVCWCSFDELPHKRILPVDLEFIEHQSFSGIFELCD